MEEREEELEVQQDAASIHSATPSVRSSPPLFTDVLAAAAAAATPPPFLQYPNPSKRQKVEGDEFIHARLKKLEEEYQAQVQEKQADLKQMEEKHARAKGRTFHVR